MSIVNRRNAVLGWAVWNVATRMAKTKAKRSVPTGDAKPGWIRRVVFVGVGFAAAAGAAALFWRNKSSDETAPPEE